MKILINRTDNLGDIIYTLHLAGLLKKFHPNCQVCFLVRSYAAPLFEYATDVDSILIWEQFKSSPLIKKYKTLNEFDVFINAKAQSRIAWYAFCARIKTRIGSARRWFNFLFCNKHISITRKGSSKHEVDLNARLLEPLIPKHSLSTPQLFSFIHLDTKKAPPCPVDLPPNKILIICHPASNGNGREWPIGNFIELIQLSNEKKYHFILTGSPSEKDKSNAIQSACSNVTNLVGTLSLKEFMSLISHADVLIASGTGPLHIAAALGIKTIGLFPPIHALDSKRWGPQFNNANNLEINRVCQQKCDNQFCPCMAALTPVNVLKVIE